MKSFYQKPVFWLLAAGIAAAGSGLAMVNLANPTNVAETSVDSHDANLRSRRYKLKSDVQTMRREIEAVVPIIKTRIWGGNWKIVNAQNSDSSQDKAVIRAEVPVVFFTDDLQIMLNRENDEIIVNVRSASRVGKGDLGENRRHVLQILEKLDERFGQE